MWVSGRVRSVTATATQPLASFRDLRYLADNSQVTRACIELRKSEFRARDWDLVPDPAAGPADPRDMQEGRDNALRFLRRPDPNYGTFGSWLDAALELVFTVDAFAILMSTGCAILLDGACLEPVLDDSGRVTRYRHHLRPVSRRTAMEMITEGPASGHIGEYGPGDILLYRPCLTRAWTPFGFSPVEQAISYRNDGSVDVGASEAKILKFFALPPEALGMPPVDDDGDGWLHHRLMWFASVMDEVLGNSGLRWKWLPPAASQ